LIASSRQAEQILVTRHPAVGHGTRQSSIAGGITLYCQHEPGEFHSLKRAGDGFPR
jgi:hypothetical protein